jgi:hypothetical protein
LEAKIKFWLKRKMATIDYCLAMAFVTIALSSAAQADQSGTTTLAPNTLLNLDTGSVSSSGADSR